MPIKKENLKLYPDDWKQIRLRILERADNRCEGSPKYPDCRARNHEPHPDTGSRVVLTLAHLDHNPENCDESNLRAWCQRCHNQYDAPRRAKNAAETRRKKKEEKERSSGQLKLFEDDGED